jgi:hypothetical protein
MLRSVALITTDVSEERMTFIIKVLRLLITANFVPISPILVTLMIEALRSSKTSVFTRVTQFNVGEVGILQSHRSENLESYNVKSVDRKLRCSNCFAQLTLQMECNRYVTLL